MEDNEIWLCFMVGALATSSGRVAAGHADDALEEYRKRWVKEKEPGNIEGLALALRRISALNDHTFLLSDAIEIAKDAIYDN